MQQDYKFKDSQSYVVQPHLNKETKTNKQTQISTTNDKLKKQNKQLSLSSCNAKTLYRLKYFMNRYRLLLMHIDFYSFH